MDDLLMPETFVAALRRLRPDLLLIQDDMNQALIDPEFRLYHLRAAVDRARRLSADLAFQASRLEQETK